MRGCLAAALLVSVLVAGCAQVSSAPTPDPTVEQARIAAAVRATLGAQVPPRLPSRTPRATNTPRPVPTAIHETSAALTGSFEEVVDRLDGKARIYSADRKDFLGLISSNCFAKESLANQFGPYGNEFNSKSLLNEFGDYGSKFSSKSAFNDFASHPPIILMNDEVVGYLTTNQLKTPRIDPRLLIAYLQSKGNCK